MPSLNLSLGNIKKRSVIFITKRCRFLSFLKKNNTQRSGMAANTLPTLPITQRRAEVGLRRGMCSLAPQRLHCPRSPNPKAMGLMMLSWYLELVSIELDESTLGAFNFQLGYLTLLFFLRNKNITSQSECREDLLTEAFQFNNYLKTCY